MLLTVTDCAAVAVSEHRSEERARSGAKPQASLFSIGSAGDVPTTVRLTDRKGPTAPAQRMPGELRHLLGGSTYLLNLVHSTDEPADVVRELGIYLDAVERAEAIARSRDGADRSAAARAIADELYATTPARSFDTAVAKRAILEQADLRGLEVDSPRAAWAEAIERIWRTNQPVDEWDVLVVGAAVLPMRTPEGAQTLGGVDPSTWLCAATKPLRS